MKKIFGIFIVALAFSVTVKAQEPLRTAYFLDGYNFVHQLNPALPSARSYFTLPGLGYANLGVQSNMGISTFLFPQENGQLTTFMNSSISSETFMKGLNNNNILNEDVSTALLSIGAWGRKNGFTSIDLNLKTNASINLPRDLFMFMKNVGGAEEYNISNLGVKARSYLELSLGHTQRINKRLSVGGKVKFLLGVLNADLNIDKMNIRMNESVWSVTAKGSLRGSTGNFVNIPSYAESGAEGSKYPDQVDFGGIRFNNPFDGANDFSSIMSSIGNCIGGYGVAIDLGAAYEVINGLTISAAIRDLGFINWKSTIYATTDEASWEFTGFDNISFEEGSENSIENQINGLTEGIEDMIVLRKKPGSSYNEMLAMTVHAAAEYTMPFWKGMSVGALLTSRIQGAHSWTEGRFSLNLALGNVFAISGSYAISNFGSNFGAALNLHSKVFSFYIGADAIPMHLTTPMESLGIGIGIPYKPINLGLNFGLTWNLSKRKDILGFRE